MSQSPVIVSSKQQFDSILKSSKIVVADFFATWCPPCKELEPVYDALSKALSRPNSVVFVKVDTDKAADVSREWKITALPTFLLFRDAKVIHRMKGAETAEVSKIIPQLLSEIDSLGEASESASGRSSERWVGAEIPRGYSDITDQVEIRNCELLNAGEDAGPVKVLFESARPSTLNKEGDVATKDFVQSGADDQLLLFVPFQGSVKLHTLQITSVQEGQDQVSRPEVIHLYINRPRNMDFSEADDTEPTQAITLKAEDWNSEATANINLRFVKFQKTTTLVVYVQKGCDGAETVRLDRIALIGEVGTKREMGILQKVGDDE
ncbi:uncharacterized protein UV8b_02557 [Ustilaginoidea virens]|uniref:Uncharacterized protein n=1 Tax=Ustilaginoidea virens TaxID=1159556 RepID=A0A063C636_USTVR|nr:uncharacterized protein UV8b_02557 [Ustilaginoidea virens]QUC18316.1 hypothetical protein UV8b_02557 [Ustilaginoidea virens]GAO19241.1 hypothetical protein UVI_02054890 [Ustilaginoidea virens]